MTTKRMVAALGALALMLLGTSAAAGTAPAGKPDAPEAPAQPE